MTADEEYKAYEEKAKDLTGGLPPEFADYAMSVAYDRGHAYGYGQVLSILEGIVYDLEKVVKAYTKRIT